MYSTLYRGSLKPGNIEVHEIGMIVFEGCIELAQIEWEKPVELAPKKKGCNHFGVEYNKLKSVTKQDRHPNLHMDKCQDSLARAQSFFC